MYSSNYKFLIDKIISFLVLVIFFPLLLLLVAILSIEHRGKPFFFQYRGGYKGELFKIYKLKTLKDEVDANGKFLPLEARVTSFGKFLRRYSLDELPQLLNVLNGDMSLVGPRPLLSEYLEVYNDDQMKRHNVRPGITGWAQINGRNNISWQKKFKYDLWYTRNLSFVVDMVILYRTAIGMLFSGQFVDSTSLEVPLFKNAEVE